MTDPCEACNEDPDLGAMCPVAELRHVPSSPREQAPAPGDMWDATDMGLRNILDHRGRHAFVCGVADERARSAAELAALRTRENWLDGEVGRLRAALEEAHAAASAMKERCAKVADDFRVRADGGVPLVDVDDWPDAIARQIRALK